VAITETCFEAAEIDVGFHPDGYRIDRTASPMNRYTKWEILPGNRWTHPKPVYFHLLPPSGWIKKDKFDWDKVPVGSIG
jgi:hypothetical protein